MRATVNIGTVSWSESYWESRNDDHPVTTWHKLLAVEIDVDGFAKWGPVKYRIGAKREHTGVARAMFRQRTEFEHDTNGANEAEVLACEIGALLESKGFEVDLTFKDRFLKEIQSVQWLDGSIPKALRKKVRVEVKDLTPTKS
jgi:hypothetical protein